MFIKNSEQIEIIHETSPKKLIDGGIPIPTANLKNHKSLKIGEDNKIPLFNKILRELLYLENTPTQKNSPEEDKPCANINNIILFIDKKENLNKDPMTIDI